MISRFTRKFAAFTFSFIPTIAFENLSGLISPIDTTGIKLARLQSGQSIKCRCIAVKNCAKFHAKHNPCGTIKMQYRSQMIIDESAVLGCCSFFVVGFLMSVKVYDCC